MMADRRTVKDRAAMAEIAGGRAGLYDMLVGIFGHLPDQQFLGVIRGPDLQCFLENCRELGSSGFKSGLRNISSYQSAVKDRSDEEVLTELSVDRTRILRGTGGREMKPPYEGLYRKRKGLGDSVLEVKRFYRRAGLMPDETVHESPDYLCVELDFMKQLCLREQAQWSSSDSAEETLLQEEEFLRTHLGSWVGDFCRKASEYARTDFYKGFALILDASVGMDMQYLGDMARRGV
jgi:TorA maturation chaperone TorD